MTLNIKSRSSKDRRIQFARRKCTLLVTIFFTLVSNSVRSQNLTWYFGNNAAIEFRSGVAYPSTWKQKTNTAAGMLWGKDGKPVLYMTSRFSYNSAGDTILSNPPQIFNAPECMFLRKPGSADTVYSFQAHQHDDERTNEGWAYLEEGAFSMHVFALSGNDGKGSVRLATDTLVMPFVGRVPIGKAAASSTLLIPHANGRDVWFILPVCSPPEYHVYRVTHNGLEKPPTIFASNYPRGWKHGDTLHGSNQGTYGGQIKSTMDGRHFALVAGLRGRLLYYDFDPVTGVISNEREFSDSSYWQDDFYTKDLFTVAPYGLEFSPDGKLLYVTSTLYFNWLQSNWDAALVDSVHGELWQYDLTSGDPNTIRNSRLTIVPLSKQNKISGLQLGPDGKIWVGQVEQGFVSCIENPNARGQACGFKKVALTLPDSAKCRLGFPVMPINMLTSSLTIGSVDACLGDTMHIPLYGSFITDSVVWDFDDPQSGSANTGLGKTGKHYYNTPGAYSVSATMYVGSEAQPTVRQWVYVHERPTAQATASHNPVCENDTVTLFSSGGVTARWYDDTVLIAEGHDATIRPTKPTVYTCIVETAFGCLDTTYIMIETRPSPDVAVTGETAICLGERITLTAHGAQAYSWNSGPRDYLATYSDSTASIAPERTTAYICTGVNAVGCSTTVEHIVRVDKIPDLKTYGSTTVCASVESIIGATGARQYLWIDDTGDTITTDSNFFVYPRRTTTYTVIGTSGECTVKGSVTITVLPGPQISVTGDSVICGTGSATLTASGFEYIKWIDDGNSEISKAHTIVVSPISTTRYRAVSNADTTCADTSEFIVRVGVSPDIAAHANKDIVCIGDTVVMSATGAERYVWMDDNGAVVGIGDSLAIHVMQGTTYSVSATDSIGCASTRSVTIQTVSPSTVWFDVRDTVVDVAEGRVSIPVLMHTPSALIGRSIGPLRLELTTFKRSLYVDSISGMAAVQTIAPVPEIQSFELSTNRIVISELVQSVATIHALPLVDSDSITTISVELIELGGIPACGQDSVNDGAITITGCGRSLHAGVTFVQAASLKATPNPVSDVLSISVTSGLPGLHHLLVFDAFGREVYSTTFSINLHEEVQRDFLLDKNAISEGIALIRFETPNGVIDNKVVVLR